MSLFGYYIYYLLLLNYQIWLLYQFIPFYSEDISLEGLQQELEECKDDGVSYF